MNRPAGFLCISLLVASIASAPLAASAAAGISVSKVVNVSRDQTAQNETPLAVNPLNPLNMITGANDWNYNDGCAVNASLDGGKSWTTTFPNGFLCWRPLIFHYLDYLMNFLLKQNHLYYLLKL